MDLSYIWAVMFSAVASMQYHPGAGRGDSVRLNLAECAQVADMMMECYKARFH